MQPYGSFEERGYKVESYMAVGKKGGSEWHIKAFKNNKLIKEKRIPMLYEPRFGPDVHDVRTLEKKTEEFLRALP